MKLPIALIVIAGTILFSSGCELVNPILIALNMPLEVCALINSGNAWNDTATYNIEDEIAKVSSDYVDKVKATRISDVTIYMSNPPASGTASGSIQYALDGGTLVTLATFSNVPFDSLKAPGVSIIHTSLITYNAPALAALLSAMQDPDGLPSTTTITIHTQGTSSVTVPQDTEICTRIQFQADVEL